jgi:hypothetical protein
MPSGTSVAQMQVSFAAMIECISKETMQAENESESVMQRNILQESNWSQKGKKQNNQVPVNLRSQREWPFILWISIFFELLTRIKACKKFTYKGGLNYIWTGTEPEL